MILDSLDKFKASTVSKEGGNPMFLLMQSPVRLSPIGFPLWGNRAA